MNAKADDYILPYLLIERFQNVFLVQPPYGSAGHEEPYKICKESSGDRISGLFDSGGAKVDTDGVEGGFRGAQHHGDGSADEGIGAMGGHQISSYGQSGTTADGTD